MMLGESREQFLGRVREALSHRGQPVVLPDDLEITRVVGARENLIDRFLTSVVQAKMTGHRVPDVASLVECILQIVKQDGVKSALIPLEDWPGRDEVLAAFRSNAITLLSADDLDAAFTADVGITGVQLAVAETGSIILTSGGRRRRLSSLAVPLHIAIVSADQIVADLLDWAGRDPSKLPASVVLVSAPSKTADIELTLVMGVHGPRMVHVIVVG